VTDDHDVIVALKCGNGMGAERESDGWRAQDGTSDSMAALNWPEIVSG
jgi:hypothetical protein